MARKIGTLRGTLAGLRQDFATGDMEIVFKLHKDMKQNAKRISDEAREIELSLTVEKYAEKRSLDANAYFWKLAGELAAVLNITTTEIYREYIKEVGNNFEIVPIRNDAKERWVKNWASNGIGWICEDLGPSKHEGYSNIICYAGSSTYDTHQMYNLTQLLVEDCKAQNIETRTPEELEAMLNEWENKQKS